VRAFVLPVVLAALATPALGQSLQVVGYAGVLGEWELTATVTGNPSWWSSDYVGPLAMTHVGLCTQDGPERKVGEIRFRISGPFSSMNATLQVDGVECAYSATLSDAYKGLMNCPGRRPVPLTVWVK
jgi:hypothetical protein